MIRILNWSFGRRVWAAMNCLRGRPTMYRCHVKDGELVFRRNSFVAENVIEESSGWLDRKMAA